MDEKTYAPPPVTGYRTLTQTEVDLMNKIKAHGEATLSLLGAVGEHLRNQIDEVGTDGPDALRVQNAEVWRWTAIAKTDFQTALMALTRAVAQPTNF